MNPHSYDMKSGVIVLNMVLVEDLNGQIVRWEISVFEMENSGTFPGWKNHSSMKGLSHSLFFSARIPLVHTAHSMINMNVIDHLFGLFVFETENERCMKYENYYFIVRLLFAELF